jgi:hypothetical protein
MVHANITSLSLLSERNHRGMSTRTRRGEAPEFGVDVDPEAEARAIRKAKRDVAQRTEEAFDAAAAIRDEEQREQSIRALAELREEANDALDKGVSVDEVAQQIDLSVDSFMSAITGAGDVDPDVVGYLEQSAVDLTLEALAAMPPEVERSLRELGELPDIPVVQGTTSEEEEEEESSESELGLSEAEQSTDDEFAAEDDLGGISAVRAAASEDSDDDWSTADSPTPVPERRATLAARLVGQVNAPRERGVRSEEAEAANVGELKARRQQEAAAAARARREDPQEQERKRVARQQREAAKTEEAAKLARLALMRRRFTDARTEISLESRQVSAPGASTIAAQGPVVADTSPPRDEGAVGDLVGAAVESAVDEDADGDLVEDPSLGLEVGDEDAINAEAERTLAELGSDLDSGSEVSYYEEPTQGALDQIDALIAEAQAGLSQSGIDLDATSADELSRVLQTEVQQRLDMSEIKDRLTDAGQATAFSNATRQTPRLLRLIAQGVYAPTAFTGTAGKAAAMKIEQQLAYAERQRVGTRRAVDPIVVRERPTKSNPGIRRWRRPRFTTSTVPR